MKILNHEMQQCIEMKRKYKMTRKNLTLNCFLGYGRSSTIYNLYVIVYWVIKHWQGNHVEVSRSYLQNHISLKNYFHFAILSDSHFFFFNDSCNCPAGFSFNEDWEQDLVSGTSESHDFLRNYKKYRMIRTCAFPCMRRNGRTHRKMTAGLF